MDYEIYLARILTPRRSGPGRMALARLPVKDLMLPGSMTALA